MRQPKQFGPWFASFFPASMRIKIVATIEACLRICVVLVFHFGFGVLHTVSAAPLIAPDAGHKFVTLNDGSGQLSLRLNYSDGCALDHVSVRGRDVVAEAGVYTGVRIGDEWFNSTTVADAKITLGKNSATVSGIHFGKAGQEVLETWTFTTLSNRIVWKINRKYSAVETLSDMAFPVWNFSNLETWTGGLLDNGGVVWSKYLDMANTTYGGHFAAVTFWNAARNDALRITPKFSGGFCGAGRFSRQTNELLSFYYTLSDEQIKPKHGQSRFLGNQQDLWKPIHTHPSEVTMEFVLQAFECDEIFDRGSFVGLSGKDVRELLNTVARYGVIDSGLTGGNGWRSGYICLHEPFFAQIAATVDAADYTANLAAFLDNARDHAIETNGRIKSRWCYGPWDTMPGSYDTNGFYEAQWGYLLDSQPDYVMNVVELFNLTGDQKWLASHKESCERALEFLTRREVDHTGLVAMMTDSHKQNRGSDWIDIIWAAYENALINAQLYAALNLWADAEETLSDAGKAANYRAFAARLKNSFNKSTADGGFWDSTNQWYVYWRDKDGSVHGNNLVTPVNFAAIAYGLCDDPARQKEILDRMETEMKKENLFYWPLSFFPYAPDEGAGSNFPFPKYENGDIFLSWGELGVRAYAAYDPNLALKYVKTTLDRYAKDGLSFQRYLRQSQRGEGDDILAGNCMPIVGLYSDIFGIQPKPNRLFLNPHTTAELNGTKLRYEMRGRLYEISPGSSVSGVSVGNCTLHAANCFGFNAAQSGFQYFSGTNSEWALSVSSQNLQLTIQIEKWSDVPDEPKEWNEIAVQSHGKVSHTIKGLRPKTEYQFFLDGRVVKSCRASDAGQVEFYLNVNPTKVSHFKIASTVL